MKSKLFFTVALSIWLFTPNCGFSQSIQYSESNIYIALAPNAPDTLLKIPFKVVRKTPASSPVNIVFKVKEPSKSVNDLLRIKQESFHLSPYDDSDTLTINILNIKSPTNKYIEIAVKPDGKTAYPGVLRIMVSYNKPVATLIKTVNDKQINCSNDKTQNSTASTGDTIPSGNALQHVAKKDTKPVTAPRTPDKTADNVGAVSKVVSENDNNLKDNPVLKSDILILNKATNNAEAEYKCNAGAGKRGQMVQPKTFIASLDPVFSKVVLNNEGLIKNGSAANVSVANGIKLDAAIQKQVSSNLFYRMGFNTNVKDGKGVIFSEKKLKNEFGLSFGFTQIRKNPGRFYESKDCADLKKERQLFEDSLLTNYANILSYDSAKLKTEIEHLELQRRFNPDSILTPTQFKAIDSLLKVKKALLSGIRKIKSTSVAPEALIKEELSKWELTKALKWTGYTVHWIDYDVQLPFKGYYLYDSTSATNDTYRYNLYLSVNADISYNYVRYTPKWLAYFYGSIGLVLDRAIIALDQNDIIVKEEQSYWDVSHKPWTAFFIPGIMPSINSTIFLGKDKIIGLEAAIAYKYFFYDKMNAESNNIWNARIGFLFSLNGEGDISKGTLGLFTQLVDYSVNKGSIKDNLAIGVRLGLPFSKVFGL